MDANKLAEILRILESDAKATPDRIGTMVGLPEDEVREAIRQAEANRAIVTYRTFVDWRRVGQEEILALIEVKVVPQRNVGFDAVANRIARFPEVRSMYLVSGAFDLAVIVIGRTMQEVANFVSEKLAPLDSVQSTVTHFLLKRYKEDGVLMAEPERIQQLPVSP